MGEREIISFMFKIQINNGAVANQQMSKEIAKVSARTILKERSHQEEFKAKDSWYRQRVDPNDAIKNAKLYKKDYERTLPETLSPQTESEMWKRAKQIKDEIVIGMPSREELHPVKGFMDNGTMKWVVDESKMQMSGVVEKELKWQKNNAPKIEEFKNLMRHLDKDNPTAGDIEKYRPKGGI